MFSLRQNTYFGYIALDFYEKKKGYLIVHDMGLRILP